MIAIILFSCLTTNIHAQTGKEIEIFYINKGEVIKKLPMEEDIQKEVEEVFQGITDIYRGFEPIPKKGYMVRLPLEPAIQMKNEWFHDFVSEVIMIFPEYENPHLMVFNDENNSFFFTFDASVDDLLTKVDLKLKGMK